MGYQYQNRQIWYFLLIHIPVSYTHLDVYKRQVDNNPPSGSIDGNYATSVTVHWVSGISYVNASCTTTVSYTHLDVYKRQELHMPILLCIKKL